MFLSSKTAEHLMRWVVYAAMLAGCVSSKSVLHSSSADTSVLPQEAANPTVIPQVLPTDSNTSNKVVQSRSLNDITVEVNSAKIIATGVEMSVCYTTLDGGDWYPTPGHLFYGTSEVYPDEYEFTTEVRGTELGPGRRCVLVRYRIDDPASVTPPIEFSLIDVAAIPREMPPCQNFQERLATNSKARAAGLEVQCKETDDGNIQVTLLAHNQSVDENGATGLMNRIANAEIAGPWVFTLQEIER